MQQTRPLFVVNPVAGNGRAGRLVPRIRAAFAGPAEIELTSGPGDAATIARRGAAEGFGPIVGVGGDGTLQEIVCGVMRCPQPPPVGIVAAGSGNDLVRGLGLPRDPVEATRRVWCDEAGPIDVGACNDQFFLNVAGVGLDTRVARAVNERTGWPSGGTLAYLIQALAELRRHVNPELTIHVDDAVLQTRSLLVAVANGRYFAGGMKIAPDAKPADGWFDVVIGGDLTRRETLSLMPKIFFGRHVGHPKVTIVRAQAVRIESTESLEVQLDGEIVDVLPAKFRVVPQALRIVGWTGKG